MTSEERARAVVNHADFGVRMESLIAKAIREAVEEERRTCAALMSRSLDYLDQVCDEGPAGEGWQSAALIELIERIERLVAEPKPPTPR